LLSGEDWENVCEQHDIDIAYKEFLQTLALYFNTALPLRKVNINKQTNKKSVDHTHAPVVISKNGSPISEPTHVAELFNLIKPSGNFTYDQV
jgi:hypothetical protein